MTSIARRRSGAAYLVAACVLIADVPFAVIIRRFVGTIRIDGACVHGEIARLKRLWSTGAMADDGLGGILSEEQAAAIDPFDRIQLAHVIAICRRSRSLSRPGVRCSPRHWRSASLPTMPTGCANICNASI